MSFYKLFPALRTESSIVFDLYTLIVHPAKEIDRNLLQACLQNNKLYLFEEYPFKLYVGLISKLDFCLVCRHHTGYHIVSNDFTAFKTNIKLFERHKLPICSPKCFGAFREYYYNEILLTGLAE